MRLQPTRVETMSRGLKIVIAWMLLVASFGAGLTAAIYMERADRQLACKANANDYIEVRTIVLAAILTPLGSEDND